MILTPLISLSPLNATTLMRFKSAPLNLACGMKTFLLLILTLGAPLSRATNPADSTRTNPSGRSFRLIAATEYMAPTVVYRDLRTINVHVMAGKNLFGGKRFSGYAGIVLTHAWGRITQYDENFRDVYFFNNAYGIGINSRLRGKLIAVGKLALLGELGGALILYSERFP